MKKTAEIIEEVEVWRKSLVATGAETKSIAALTKALKGLVSLVPPWHLR